MWDHWNRLYFNNERGQALLEIAVFGSIIVMLLGILVNYGLRFQAQQRVMQDTFRKAQATAIANQSSGSYMILQDKHIPDASDTFGIGSVMPFSSSASVVRDYHMNWTPDNESELPYVAFEIKGLTACPGSYRSPAGSSPPCEYLTAGFRWVNDMGSAKAKYEEIYGSGNVENSGRIIDPCEGELVDYSTAYRICRMIVDKNACVHECNNGTTGNCESVCSPDTEIPWYCQGYFVDPLETSYTKYVFPKVNQLFVNAAGRQALGIQSDYVSTARENNQLVKQEGTSGITTSDNIDWQSETTREMIYKPYNDRTGNTVKQEMKTNVSQKEAQTWQENW